MVPPASFEIISFGEFQAKLGSRELCRDGTRVRLPDQSFHILAMLLERPGELVTREEIRQRLWPDGTFVDFDHGLNNAVNRLREALADSAEKPLFIETLHRRGYRFIGRINGNIRRQSISTEAEKIAPQPADMDSSAARATTRIRALWSTSAAVILLLIAAAIYYKDRWRTPETRIQSLAVLPFENLSGDPTQDYFSDGVTDGLTTELSHIRPLRVISRTSAMHYKGTHRSLPSIAEELSVDAVVEGSVVRSGNRVHVTAQLVHAPSDRLLWAKAYDREISEIVSVQQDLVQNIAREVRAELIAVDGDNGSRPPVNPEAYEAYLKGRYFWNKRTEEGLTRSIGYFEQAVKQQPDYAQAYTGLSDAYALLGFAPHSQFSRSETMARARAAVLKALEIDDRSAEAHTSLASISMIYDWNWPLAEKEFKRAIELDPGYATAHHWYAFYCASQRRTEDALVEIRIARKLDPLSIIINADVAHLLYFAHRYDEAIGQVRRTLEMDANLAGPHVTAGLAYLGKGQYPESIAELETAVHISKGGPDAMAFLGLAYAQGGRKEDARNVIRKVRTGSFARYDPVLKVAWIYAALGDRNRAFAWAEKAYKARSPEFYTLSVLPALDPFRADPRFQDLIRRLGLPE